MWLQTDFRTKVFFTDAHNDTRHNMISRMNVRERGTHIRMVSDTLCFEGVLYTHTKGCAASEVDDDNIMRN